MPLAIRIPYLSHVVTRSIQKYQNLSLKFLQLINNNNMYYYVHY